MWVVTVSWCALFGVATIEARERWRRNRVRLRRARERNSPYEWAAVLRNRRSRNFTFGFAVGLSAGLASMSRLILISVGVFAPIPRDTSLAGVAITLLVVLMGLFFYRAKHADTVGDQVADDLALARRQREKTAENDSISDSPGPNH